MKTLLLTMSLVLAASMCLSCESEEDQIQGARDSAAADITDQFKKINAIYDEVLSILQSVNDQETAVAALPKIQSIAPNYSEAYMISGGIPSLLGDPAYPDLNQLYADAEGKKGLIQSEIFRIGDLGERGSNTNKLIMALNTASASNDLELD